MGEMCVDGWYKGQSLRTGKSGVFPGNHVHQVDPSAKVVRPRLLATPIMLSTRPRSQKSQRARAGRR